MRQDNVFSGWKANWRNLLVGFALLLSGCAKEVTDTQGRVFERVRAAKTNSTGIVDIELWQLKGRVGPNYPSYIKLMGEPPTFTQTQ